MNVTLAIFQRIKHITHILFHTTLYTHTHWHTFCTKVMISIQKCACTAEWNKVCVINTAFWVPTYQLPNNCPSYLSFKCSGLELHEWAFVCCKDQKRAQYIQLGICNLFFLRKRAFVTLEDHVVQSCPLNLLGLGSIHSVTKNGVLSTNVYLYYKIKVICWLICAKQFTTQT